MNHKLYSLLNYHRIPDLKKEFLNLAFIKKYFFKNDNKRK